jgi:hypothetical protein
MMMIHELCHFFAILRTQFPRAPRSAFLSTWLNLVEHEEYRASCGRASWSVRTASNIDQELAAPISLSLCLRIRGDLMINEEESRGMEMLFTRFL